MEPDPDHGPSHDGAGDNEEDPATIRLFVDAPNVASITEELGARSAPLVARVLSELRFVLKSCTRLGRVVTVPTGDGQGVTWGHDTAPARADVPPPDWATSERRYVPFVPRDDRMSMAEISLVVAERVLVPLHAVQPIIFEFFLQLGEHDLGEVEVLSPPMRIDTRVALRRALIDHLDVLEHLGLRLTLHSSMPRFGTGPRADLVCRDADGDWVVLRITNTRAGRSDVEQLASTVDAASAALGAPYEAIRGFLISDGIRTSLLEAICEHDQLSQLNLRAIDLPAVRAQRWQIEVPDGTSGWVAVAADGRSIINAAGAAVPPGALTLRLDELAVVLGTATLRPLPIGERSPTR